MLKAINANSAELLKLNRDHSDLICSTGTIEISPSRFEAITTRVVKFNLVVHNLIKSS